MTLSTPRLETIEKLPGAEPLPGYRLLVPLGRGGFGEVWKCEAPGGLQKAIKFVAADGDRFRQEVAAFEQIKSIRHPFLLGLDRVELSGGELVMVMELADCQLNDRFHVCRADALPGIPRGELIGYLEEAAESLDMISTRYGLQHLDVKPENLFVVSGHAKVGDYGLVRRTQRLNGRDDDNRGFTPRYTAPEVLLGRVDIRSDQYSLALVYVELLTGRFPYAGRTPQQLVLEHLQAAPELSMLAPCDRAIVGRALAKTPGERYLSCSEFMEALRHASSQPDTQLMLPMPEMPQETPAPAGNVTVAQGPGLSNIFSRAEMVRGQGGAPVSEDRDATTLPVNRPSASGKSPPTLPVPSARATQARFPVTRRAEPPAADPFAGLTPVMPVSILLGATPRGVPLPIIHSDDYVDRIVQTAQAQAESAQTGSQPENGLALRFLCTLPAPMVPLKLLILNERCGVIVQKPELYRVVLWREARRLRKGSRVEMRQAATQRHGLEVVISLPTPPSAELNAVGRVIGMPEDSFVEKAREDLPEILSQVRGLLENLAERRSHPRLATNFPVRLYPLYPDGDIGQPVGGHCRDVSLGGARFLTTAPVRAERLYAEFHSLEELRNMAVYFRVVRNSQDPETQGIFTAGRFRTRSQ